MNLTILNRDAQHPADGWYYIEGKGYFPGIADDGRKILQVIDDAAITSIVNRFNSAASAGTLPHGSEMLIDREHFRHHRDATGQKDMDSAAYGWIKELRAAPAGDGYQMKNRWTGVGQQAVDTGVYRFVSTEYDETNPGEVWQSVAAAEIPMAVRNKYPAKDGWEYMRPTQITGLSLTNDNNNKGVKPLTILNKTTFAGVLPVDSKQKNNQGQKMKTVCTLLGLSAEADEASVHAAVTTLKNRITTLEPLEAENTKLKNRNTEAESELCESLMDAHGIGSEKQEDKTRREKLKPVLLAMKNRADRVAFLTECVPVEKLTTQPQRTQVQLKNRDTKVPVKNNTVATEGDEQAQQVLATKIRNRANELRAGKSITFDAAWNQAKQELTQPVE